MQVTQKPLRTGKIKRAFRSTSRHGRSLFRSIIRAAHRHPRHPVIFLFRCGTTAGSASNGPVGSIALSVVTDRSLMRGGSGAQEGEADAALHSPPDHRVLVLTSSGQQCGAEVKRRCGGLDVQPGAAANAWTQGGSAVIHCVRRPASPGPGVSSAVARVTASAALGRVDRGRTRSPMSRAAGAV